MGGFHLGRCGAVDHLSTARLMGRPLCLSLDSGGYHRGILTPRTLSKCKASCSFDMAHETTCLLNSPERILTVVRTIETIHYRSVRVDTMPGSLKHRCISGCQLESGKVITDGRGAPLRLIASLSRASPLAHL